MLAQWIGDFVGRMHRYKITITELSQEMEVTREYLSLILNGHREPSGIEQRMNTALDNLIEKQREEPRNLEQEVQGHEPT